ncbi:MAG: Sialic acid-binding periplasmic protein SiaP precursor [Syntrophorhabdaceae bacterium PtaU1.Bin034]|nr:MAG: Sialic acid-binding periplasmic protein SiaP precursor [Syntrophorhabdaceae bacterium PtaU1.Bin034]
MTVSTKRRIVGLVCAVLLVLCFSSHSFSADVIKLKYASFMPPAHPISQLSDQWGKELEKRTNGRVKVSFFPGGTLVTANQIYDGVVKGIIDVGWSVAAYTPGRLPLSEFMYLPLGFKNGYQASLVANEFYRKFKPKEFDDVKIFFLHSHGPGYFHTKKPVNKIEDLKGLRIKSDAQTSKVATAAGATPTTMPMLETYDALKRGLADGTLLPVESLKGWKFGEVCKHTYINSAAAYGNTFFFAMNKGKWNSLPKDIQQIMDKLNEEWFEKQARLWSWVDEDGLEFAKKAGQKIVYANSEEEAKMRERMRPLLDAYVKSMKAKGLPGDEVLKWCHDYLKTAPTK